MKELVFEELTPLQKIGLADVAHLKNTSPEKYKEDYDYAMDLIKKRALGAVWVERNLRDRDRVISEIKEAADYPILIMTDAENGMDDFLIGGQYSLSATGRPELAYVFGKAVGITAKKAGYNCVCNPLLDCAGNVSSFCGGNIRSIANTREKVAEYAAAMARGMHDAGILTVGKHYPSCGNPRIDSHMAENFSTKTAQELLENNLYPYIKLSEQGLLDGVMTQHNRCVNIDPDYPASLSKKVMGLLRGAGFDGFAVSDALDMLGVVAKFGRENVGGLAVETANDLALNWGDNKAGYENMVRCYEKGILTDESLDRAVKHVLDAQRKTLKAPVYTELTEAEIADFGRINTESVCAYTDEGLSPAIPREGRHLFEVMITIEDELKSSGGLKYENPLSMSWHKPELIAEKLRELFPDSEVEFLPEFPTYAQNWHILQTNLDYDDVVFITFAPFAIAIGEECFTSRILALAEALQGTERIAAIAHFGNPFALEAMPHIPRVILGTISTASEMATLEVLAGEREALGAPSYDITLK